MDDVVELWWYTCSQCGYEIMAGGKPRCRHCKCLMTKAAHGGFLTDDR